MAIHHGICSYSWLLVSVYIMPTRYNSQTNTPHRRGAAAAAAAATHCVRFAAISREKSRGVTGGEQTDVGGNGSKRYEDYFTTQFFLVKSGCHKVI